MRRLTALLALLLLVAVPAWAQTPNTWTEHPNTNFSTWATGSGVRAEHDACNPSSAVGAILGGWVSGAYHKTLGKYLVYRGGGHADGCWNGGAAFNPTTKAWERLTTASPNATKMTSANPDDTNFKVKYSDGTPSSVHSYGTQFCIVGGPLDGKCPTSGGIFWSRAGLSTPETPFIYDPSQPTAATAYVEKKTRPGGYGTSMLWNTTRQKAFMAGSAGVYEWEPVADVYTQLFTTTGAGTSTSLALDETAGRVYVLIGGTPVGSRLKYVDYATAATTKYQSIATTGGAGIEDLAAPGFVFAGRDAQNRVRLVGLGKASVTIPNPAGGTVTGDRAAIFVLLDDGTCGRGTATPCTWTRITPTNATSTLPPRPMANGMWNKFFAHGCDLFAIVTSEKQSSTQLPPSGDAGNVWSFRPDFALPGCGAPPPQQFALTVTAGAGGTASGPASPVTVGATVTLTKTPNSGQQFTGWTGDTVCADTFAMPARNVACQATFAPIMVSLVVNTVGQVTTSGAGSYPMGSVATLAVTSVGAGWGNIVVSGDPTCVLGPITMDRAKTCTVTARDVQAPQVSITAPTGGDIFTQAGIIQITVQATDNVGVTQVVCSANGASVPCAWDLTGLPKGHYAVGATAMDAAGNVGTATPITVTVALCPVCPPPTALYPVTVNKTGTGHGTVGGDGLYKEGDTVTLLAVPDSDSTVGTWSPAPCAASFPMPTSALTCTATFTLKPPLYALTLAAAGQGTVSGGGQYEAGTPITLTATPAAGYAMSGWGPTPCAPSFAMPANPLTCTAVFTLIDYPVTTSVVGQGTVTGAGNYVPGATVTLTATPASGYTFQGWSPAPCAASFTMPTNSLACTATFVQTTGGGPVENLADRTWKGFPLVGLGQSKHSRIIFDSKRGRMVIAGGDGTDGSGNSFTGQNVFSVDLAVGTTWTKLHGGCPTVPIAQGGVQPSRPDNVTWVYDSRRDRGVVTPAFYGGVGPICTPVYSGTVTANPTTTGFTDTALPAGVAAAHPNYQDILGRTIKFTGNVTVDLKNRYTAITAYTTGGSTLGFTAFTKPDPRPECNTDPKPVPPCPAIPISPAIGDTYTIASDDPIKKPYTFDFTTNLWTRAPFPAPPSSATGFGWGGDLHNHWGVYDPVTDAAYRYYNACGIQSIPMDGSLGVCSPVVYPAGSPTGSKDMANDMSTIDVQGRAIYIINRWNRLLMKWDIDQKKVVELIPMPANWVRPTSEFGGGDYETHIAFDSKNRVLMIPNDVSYGGAATGTLIDQTTGLNRGVYFFNVDSKTWEWEPAPTDRAVSGNTLGYDAKNNVFVYYGRSASGKPVEYWVYRYKR